MKSQGQEFSYSTYVFSWYPSCYMNIGWTEKGTEEWKCQMEEQVIETELQV